VENLKNRSNPLSVKLDKLAFGDSLIFTCLISVDNHFIQPKEKPRRARLSNAWWVGRDSNSP